MKPEDTTPSSSEKRTGKMRRDRKFSDSGIIQSQIPGSDAPQSRLYVSSEQQVVPPGVIHASQSQISLEAITNRIIYGDAVAVLKKLPENWCACAITSPPYWNMVDYGIPDQIGPGSYEHYLDQLDEVWEQVSRVLIPNGKFCLNVPLLPIAKSVSESAFGPSHTRIVIDLYSDMKWRIERKTPLRLFSLYVWEKQTTEKMFGSYPFPPNLYERNYIEFIAVFVKPGAPRVIAPEVKERSKLTQDEWMDLTQQIWWMYPENIPRLEGHPAPFPEALPNRLIAMYTFREAPVFDFPGDIVLDPLVGSGTTCVAARRMGRRFVGIDLNSEFCRYAYERVETTRQSPRVMTARRPADRPQPQLAIDLRD